MQFFSRKYIFSYLYKLLCKKQIAASYSLSWEQRKAKELFVSTADKGYPELPVLSATQDRGMIRRDENSINIFHDKKNEAGYKRVLPGQFVIHLRSFQGGFAHSTIEGITSPAYTVFGFSEPEKHDSEYWKYVFTSKSFIRRLETVTYGIRDGRSISYEEFLTLGFVYPSKAEQKAIARYLDKLSDLITLHQRKYEKLVNIKKSMLDKMFPKNGASVPEIRFKGFTDLWEQRKLEEYLEVSGQKNFEGIYTKEDVLSVSGDFGIVNQIEFQGRSFAGASVANYGVVETGDIVYTKSPLKSNPYGIIKANKGKNGIVSTLYAVYKPKQSANPEFVQIYFEQDARMNNYMHPLVNKGAKNDMKVSAENALKGQIVFPDIKEQRTISEFFRNLDTLITLHQRKLEKLVQIRKAFAERCFLQSRKEFVMAFTKEADFEEAVVKLLIERGWKDGVLKNYTEQQLIQNWANILFENNRGIDRLNDYPLTDGEMQQIMEQVMNAKTPMKLNKFINGKSVLIKRDNPDDKLNFGKEVSLKIYDRLEIAAGLSRYQIAEQPKFPTKSKILNDRRGDLMLLINGMPVIHMELKKSGVSIIKACNQIEKYAAEGIFTGLFSLVQIFVAMNPEETVYFANPGPEGQFNKSYYFHWADFYNEPMNDWKDVTTALLSIPMAHMLVGFYTVADGSDGILKVMRSYQYYAASKISDAVSKAKWENDQQRGGYIWHTTGSGKTMTSFKSAQLIASSKDADKVIFRWTESSWALRA